MEFVTSLCSAEMYSCKLSALSWKNTVVSNDVTKWQHVV